MLYNDNDAKACAWLRELIAAGHLPPGAVDGRSITEIQPHELENHAQCHFFAGIGGWPLALRLAGWPDDRPVWTGSCPCQPFSCAGKRRGTADERHLWPEFFRLIAQCRPPTVFGEQVASCDGREWLAGVFADLEGVGYAVAGADLCAAGVGAPHIRQRLFWVAYAESQLDWGRNAWQGLGIEPANCCPMCGAESECIAAFDDGTQSYRCPECGIWDGGLAHNQRPGLEGRSCQSGDVRQERETAERGCGAEWVADAIRTNEQQREETKQQAEPARRSCLSGLGQPESDGRGERWAASGRSECAAAAGWNGATTWHLCRDNKLRRIPIEPALFPLAHGLPGRVGLLRGAGNAIVPQVAAAFVRAFLTALEPCG